MAKKLTALLEQVGPSTMRATVRSHTFYVDRPTERGGEDKGAVGGEYLLTALAGCFSSHLLAAIRARDAQITAVTVEACGTLDETPERFTEFNLTVSADCEDSDALQKMVTIAERSCQVINTLKHAAPIKTLTLPRRAGTKANSG